MIKGLRNLYEKLGSATSLLSGLRAHDEQIAQLRAAITTLMADSPELSVKEKQVAQAKVEGLLAYQAISKDERQRLTALYESAATRLAAAEAEIAKLRERLRDMQAALKDRGGRT